MAIKINNSYLKKSFSLFYIAISFGLILSIIISPPAGNGLNARSLLSLPLFIIVSYFILKPSVVLNTKIGKRIASKDTRLIDSIPSKNVGRRILLAAGLTLFAELTIIRLHSSYFPLFGFYKNLSLLSCFLGLGIGYARAKKKPLAIFFCAPLLALQVIFLDTVSATKVEQLLLNPIPENLTMGLLQVGSIDHLVQVYFFLAVIFVLNALFFIPLGQLTGHLMLKTGGLKAYGWNLVGSILGIISFSIVSFAWMPPPIWIITTILLIMIFLYKNYVSAIITFLSLVITLLFLLNPRGVGQVNIYSPYQVLNLEYGPQGATLSANKTFFQEMIDLRDERIGDDEALKSWADFYNAPYLVKPNPKDVLIVGSGVGNDVAAAIRNSASNIDAVEIDPAIIRIGKEVHPERPYDNEGVKSIIADARSYIRQTEKKYDLVIYGLLDSHTLLSGKSSIRLDSFVYTVDALKEARNILKEDGVIVLAFATDSEVFGRKIYLMLEEAFDGQPPLVYGAKWPIFIAGENIEASKLDTASNFRNVTSLFVNSDLHPDKATDDWPFFYMPIRKYPISTLPLISLLLGTSVILITKFARSAPAVGFFPTSFFLGAGFMLVETKGITELALYYGSTWVVTSIVIAGILLLAFVANLVVRGVKKVNINLVYTILFTSLIVGFYTSSVNLNVSPSISKILVTLAVLLPVFFSGIAFSSEIKRFKSVSIAIFSNLLGAMMGGFLEYNSMFFGIRFLYILAFIIYSLAFISSKVVVKK